MGVIGLLFILLALTMFFMSKGVFGVNVQNMLVPAWWSFKYFIIGLVIGGFVIGVGDMFFYNPAGTATSVQYLWGGDAAVTSQGIKLKLWGKTIPISFEIAIQDVLLDSMENHQEEGIYYRSAQKREFADAIKADIATSLVVSINYADEQMFLDMADKNRSEEKLVYARIYPVYDQALKNTCKLMDAQEYISGAASQFDYYLKDQMENGMYLTEEIYDDVEELNITLNDSTKTVAKTGVKQRNKQKKYRIKKDKSGDPVRDASNSLKRYGLTVQQAAVTNIDWEKSFDDRLTLQKDQVAQTQIEKQSAEKEFYAMQNSIAKGEKEKAEVRVRLEKTQIEETIKAETAAKAAKYKEQEEINLLAAAKKESERIRIQADAEAYEISRKVAAGITPETRLQMELDAKVNMMKALAGPNGITLPTTVFQGGGGNKEASILESILSVKLLNGDFGIKK